MANRAETGFHIVTKPRPVDVRRQIADIVGRPTDVIRDEEIRTLTECVPRGSIPASLYNKYLSVYGEYAIQGVLQRAEVLFDRSIQKSSYGLVMPSYLEALRTVPEKPAGEDHQALLLGALSVDTVKEFATTVRTIFPGADCKVIDVNTEHLAPVPPEIAEVSQDDATLLPFNDETIDSVHANHLLTFNTAYNPGLYDRKEIFAEAYRVLTPGGTFMTVEDEACNDFSLTGDLLSSGFSQVAVRDAIRFVDRTEMDKYLRSTAIVPLPDAVRISATNKIIIGYKNFSSSERRNDIRVLQQRDVQ